MIARALVFVVPLCFGCRTSPATTAAPPKSIATTAIEPTAPCSVPSSIEPVDPTEVENLLVDDPLEDAPSWRRTKKGETLTSASGRTLTLEMQGPEGDVVVLDGTTDVWRAKGFPRAFGSFTLLLSPKQTLVARSFSLGLTEIFDTASGRHVATVDNASVVSPDDDYVIDPPWKMKTPSWGHVWRLSDGKSMAGIRSKAEDTFEVGVCSTGSTFAIARTADELIVFGWPHLERVHAHYPAGPGKPRFSRSGRALAMVDPKSGKPLHVFALR